MSINKTKVRLNYAVENILLLNLLLELMMCISLDNVLMALFTNVLALLFLKVKSVMFFSFVQQSIPLQQENDEEEMIFENPIMKFLNK